MAFTCNSQFTNSARAFVIGMAILSSAFADSSVVTFDRDVMAVLSKAGCNMGTCHGNLNGKGGLRLSLRGQDSWADYLAITQELGGRRINRQSPGDSLVTLKPAAELPHEGGQRFLAGSKEHRILTDWIANGAIPPNSELPALINLDVSPSTQVLVAPNHNCQLTVIATFADGQTRDVTDLATYEVSNFVASVSPGGLAIGESIGEATIMVRYLSLQEPVRLAFISDHAFQRSGPDEKNFVDRFVFQKLRALRINPNAVCEDHVFLRRAFFDCLGILPTAEEARQFSGNSSKTKRVELVQKLLARSEFADQWALHWCDLLRVEERVLDEKGTRAFHGWIRDSFANGVPLNEFAREILQAEGSSYEIPQTNFYRALRDPLTRGETTARVFLGYRLQCARCHNHPFDQWTQDDYYSWAACFAKVDYKIVENKGPDKLDKSRFVGEQIVQRNPKANVENARTNKTADPRILNDVRDRVQHETDELIQLATWIGDDNRQFARVQVNRIWFHLMGRGLVDPVDDFRVTNPASHPELLETLTDEFIRSEFDVRHLIRLIMNSATYQLASPSRELPAIAIENFAANQVRRLTAEQMLDAQCQVLGIKPKFNGYDAPIRANQIPGVSKVFRDRSPSRDDRFLTKFGKPARQMACECERSDESTLSQVFVMISDPEFEKRLSAFAQKYSMTNSESSLDDWISQLYWQALSRRPSPPELTQVKGLLKQADESVWQDLIWALLNSKEFVFRN